MGLRVLSVDVKSNVLISVKFSNKLTNTLNVSNISLTGITPDISDPVINKIKVKDLELSIYLTTALVPTAAYFLELNSVTGSDFTSVNGSFLIEDDLNNKKLITGIIDNDNIVRQFFKSYYGDNIYNSDIGTGSTISKYLDAASLVLSKAFYDVKQLRNENYLSHTVIDEQKTRGQGAFDRLNEEAAYEVIRVSQNPTNATISGSINKYVEDLYPISLQQVLYSESFTTNNIDSEGIFNINTFTFNLSKTYPIILESITFNYTSSTYVYDKEIFGYQLKDSRYDPVYSSSYAVLSDKQLKINQDVLSSSGFSLNGITSINVSYYYKNTGRIIDPESIQVYQIKESVREALPPLENIFQLKHFPIVTTANAIPTLSGVSFVDPNTLDNNSAHTGFLYELPLRFDFLPNAIGQYSIDYETGTVYVYGKNINNKGTGEEPALATYNYRNSFVSDLDYTFDDTTFEIAFLPKGNAIEESVVITFDYEDVLVNGIDYVGNVHKEALNERIDNRLVSLDAITTKNSPITNVFKLFNETSGEVYPIRRFNHNKVYFSYINPPTIKTIKKERIGFDKVFNEVLSTFDVIPAGPNSIYKFYLLNNNLTGLSEDGLAYSQNIFHSFSESSLFVNNIYYNIYVDEGTNLTRLMTSPPFGPFGSPGDYFINPLNGIVYCYNINDINYFGTISYQSNYASTTKNKIINIKNIYSQIDIGFNNNVFTYSNLDEDLFNIDNLYRNDEQYLNNDLAYPYLVDTNQIGYYDPTFVNEVTYDVGALRRIYEILDLENNIEPINFAPYADFSSKTITLNPITNILYTVIKDDGNFYVELDRNIYYQSANITFSFTVIRNSDSASLFSGLSTFSGNKIYLNYGGPVAEGEFVTITYSISMNNGSHVSVDYDKGGLYIDYDYLFDELLISYEYGENHLDFSSSTSLDADDNYYVTYKVGALRDTLLKNFGSLVNVDILNNFDIDFNRERYRDILIGALQSFTKGPTIPAMKELVKAVSHTEPEIIESIFEHWSLGSSYLVGRDIKTNITSLSPGKFDYGVNVIDDGYISLPFESNFSLHNGYIESWVIPNWKGLDNDSELTFTILSSGSPIEEEEIFIGANEIHPTYISGTNSFTLKKTDLFSGVPNKNKNGIYIYYDKDGSFDYSRWYIVAVNTVYNYKITIQNDGFFYDSKFVGTSLKTGLSTGTNKLTWNITDDKTLTFLADYKHYLFDVGEDKSQNRISIYKDISGYMILSVWDKFKNLYQVSYDVSSWESGEKHHIAASWSINSKLRRDELHLFIDGQEVPNIIRYNEKNSPYLHEKFRTINPEEILASSTQDTIYAEDLITIAGSSTVESTSIDFSLYNISPGDIIIIEESGFNPLGYSILTIASNVLTLSSTMPATLEDAKFVVNKQTFNVNIPIHIYQNIFVSRVPVLVTGTTTTTISSNTITLDPSLLPGSIVKINGIDFYVTILSNTLGVCVVDYTFEVNLVSVAYSAYNLDDEEEIPGIRAITPSYSIDSDADFNSTISIRNAVFKDDLLLIRSLGLNFREYTQEYYLWGDTTNILKTRMPPPISIDGIKVFHKVLDKTLLNTSNGVVLLNTYTSNNLLTDQPTSTLNGRTLKVNVFGENIDFTSSLTVSIDGNDTGGPIVENLIFTEQGSQNTLAQFVSINFITVVGDLVDPLKALGFVEIIEAFKITDGEGAVEYPVIKFSYQMKVGADMVATGTTTVSDVNNIFNSLDVGNYLHIVSPLLSAGYYEIISIIDANTITVASAVVANVGIVYEVLNVTNARTGFQNGYIVFEKNTEPGEAFLINKGKYVIEYYTYLNLEFDDSNYDAFIGSDKYKQNQFNGVIDEFISLNNMLTDTRIGETLSEGQDSVTRRYNRLRKLNKSSKTLALLHFDKLPLENSVDYYVNNVKLAQFGSSVNDRFAESIRLFDDPIVLDNIGYLSTRREGTIEFWVNPFFDTTNDPNYRYYFDTSTFVIEETVSISTSTIKVNNNINSVLSVKLKGNDNVDYFINGSFDGDVIYLNRLLPRNNSRVVVTYYKTNVNGDRLSVFKDDASYINFYVKADSKEFLLRTQAFWGSNTWHRVSASYRFNTGNDNVRFFVDGYEVGNILYGTSLLTDQAFVLGSSFLGSGGITSNIKFTDIINNIFLGSDINKVNPGYCLIDNLRISNVQKSPLTIFNQNIDVHYKENKESAYPVTQDLYTTFISDFDITRTRTEDFAILKNKRNGQFDFTLNIFDSFGIINSETDSKVKLALETLIKVLKPANSRVLIKYL